MKSLNDWSCFLDTTSFIHGQPKSCRFTEFLPAAQRFDQLKVRPQPEPLYCKLNDPALHPDRTIAERHTGAASPASFPRWRPPPPPPRPRSPSNVRPSGPPPDETAFATMAAVRDEPTQNVSRPIARIFPERKPSCFANATSVAFSRFNNGRTMTGLIHWRNRLPFHPRQSLAPGPRATFAERTTHLIVRVMCQCNKSGIVPAAPFRAGERVPHPGRHLDGNSLSLCQRLQPSPSPSLKRHPGEPPPFFTNCSSATQRAPQLMIEMRHPNFHL